MLAQLLIQFQKPIITENALQNVTNQQLTNDTFNNYLNNSTIERTKRMVTSNAENEVPRDPENMIVNESLIAPNYTANGK